MTTFRDRIDAGRKLAELVPLLERPIVLGPPRDGVPVAAEVAMGAIGAAGATDDVEVDRLLAL